MIKINLLGTERAGAATTSRFARFTLQGQQLALSCGLLLVVSAGIIYWRWQALQSASAQLEADITAAQQETARLHTVIADVQQFEQRRTQLQQRVGLIEQLRRDQAGPVHMLDQLSLALPPMMWLTNLTQTARSSEVVIEGRATGLTTLSDYVVNLEASGFFKKSIEIVSTQLDSAAGSELVRFTLRAQFQRPAQAPISTVGAAVGVAPAPAPAKPPT